MKKKVLFYMQVPFMDVNLEFIKLIKDKYDLHVLIELPSTKLHANIFNLNINPKDYNSLTSFWDIADQWNLSFLVDYFTRCSSVHFAIYKTNSKIKNFYITSKAIIKYIRAQNFDCFHFDDFSARQSVILPFINIKKHLVINIHDPTPHKGEFEWKRFLIRKLFYGYASYYITFSNYSKSELEKLITAKNRIVVFRLLPYTVFKKFQTPQAEIKEGDRYISFLGRLSPYKGLDILIEAIADILKEFPRQKFLIAGKSSFGYSPNFACLEKSSQAVSIIERHLTNEEIANIISSSELVVCPYLEATQSGVVMTSYALNCPVLVTDTGGLAEYISDNVTGLIVREISKEGLISKLKEFISGNLYETMHDNIKSGDYTSQAEIMNLKVIKTIYN